MNIYSIVAPLIMLSAPCIAQEVTKTSRDAAIEVKPFTAETNYMSMLGYLSQQYYVATGEKRSKQHFKFGYGVNDRFSIRRTGSYLSIDSETSAR